MNIIRPIIYGAFQRLFEEQLSGKLAKLEEFRIKVETILNLEDNGVDEGFDELAMAAANIVGDRVVEEVQRLKAEIIDVSVSSGVEAKDAVLDALGQKRDAFMGDRTMSERMILQGVKSILLQQISKDDSVASKAAFVDRLINATDEDILTWIKWKLPQLG